MQWILMAVAVLMTLFLALTGRRTTLTATVAAMLSTFVLAYFFLMLYVCKLSMNLTQFQRYFPLPRWFVLFLYDFPLQRRTVLSMLNLCCGGFLFSAGWFGSLFWPDALRTRRWPLITLTVMVAVQLVLFDPFVYPLIYRLLYPTVMSSVQIEQLWDVLSAVFRTLDTLLLVGCALLLLRGYLCTPRIRLLRSSFLQFALSCLMLLITYETFLGDMPRLMIRYAAQADVVTYRLLYTRSYIPLYQSLPYVLTVLAAMLAAFSYRMAMQREELDARTIKITQSIDAASTSTRTLCHYLKNEVLSLQAEVEEIPQSPENQAAVAVLDDHLTGLFERLNDMHRSIRDNSMSLRPEPLDRAILQVAEAVRALPEAQGVTMDVALPTTIPVALIDETFMEQALTNLVRNALDAVQRTEIKRITLQLRSNLRWSVLDVIDTGCGISPEMLPELFTPFVSSKPLTRSWGIGLSLTHRIITSFGGRIEVESKVGQGTTFHLMLPELRTHEEARRKLR